jgi:hypothetical protein
MRGCQPNVDREGTLNFIEISQHLPIRESGSNDDTLGLTETASWLRISFQLP